MIIPAKIVNVKKPIVPAVIQKELLPKIIPDKTKYVADFIYRLKPVIEKDLGILDISSLIHFEIVNSSSEKEVIISFPDNTDVYIVNVNYAYFNSLHYGEYLEVYLTNLAFEIAKALRYILYHESLMRYGFIPCEYLDFLDLEDTEDFEIESERYANDFINSHKTNIRILVKDCIKAVDSGKCLIQVTKWMSYVYCMSTYIDSFSQFIPSHVSFCPMYIDQDDIYYIIEYNNENDIIYIKYNCNIDIDTIEELIEYTCSVIVYSFIEIANEYNDIFDHIDPNDLDKVNMLMTPLRHEMIYLYNEFKFILKEMF